MSIISVQKFSLQLGDNDLTASAELAAETVTANCIPFITSRVTSRAGALWDEFRQWAIESYFSGSTVVVERQSAGVGQGQILAEVTVVEFDGTDVVVQQGQYAMANTEASDVVASLTDLGAGYATNVFLYHTWGRGDSNTNSFDDAAIRGRITGTQELTFDRAESEQSVSGRWYLADATVGGDFTVQAASISLATGATSDTASITAVTANKTFLLGSHTANGTDSDSVAANCPDITLDDPTPATWDTIALQRDASGGPIEWSGFAVTMTDNTTVQRGTRVQSTSIADDQFDITTPVTVADSRVHIAGSSGSIGGGSWAGAGSDYVADIFVGLDFVDTNTIRMQRQVLSPAASDADLSWEVIEWDVGGAPPAAARRVMVR